MEMSDLIKREDAIKAIKLWMDDLDDIDQSEEAELKGYNLGLLTAEREVGKIPAVERNCFTCGIVDGQMIFRPEKVSEEVLKANDRAISLAEVCKILQEEYEVCPATWERFRNLSAVEPKQGEWIDIPRKMFKCSECGQIYQVLEPKNYCSNCGARMKGESDDKERSGRNSKQL